MPHRAVYLLPQPHESARAVVRELPRVMTIYDVDMPLKTARAAISYHFRKNERLQDGRVIGLLIAKGYMELEETLKQWKQKTHLLRILEVRLMPGTCHRAVVRCFAVSCLLFLRAHHDRR